MEGSELEGPEPEPGSEPKPEQHEPELNAPLSELRVAKAVRRYERFKVTLMMLVLLIDIVIGLYLVGIAHSTQGIGRSNQESLKILRCAVSKTVQVDEHGKPRTPEGARQAFNKCVNG